MSAPTERPDPVQFVCLDKGQHPKRYPRVSFLPTGIEFKCIDCGRDTRINELRFAIILAELRTAGIEQVDISVLPY